MACVLLSIEGGAGGVILKGNVNELCQVFVKNLTAGFNL